MPALYKVFLVEDEVVIRKNIRDITDWAALGFEFCGEAPDGEMALPMIQACKPDLLITDIKMPFMDGLQLSRIIRESMPEIKIIILSGHNEFHYAQEAIKLGITDYLLKPITPQNLAEVVQKVAAQIDEEKRARESLQFLKNQVEDNLATLKENFLLKLVLGNIPPSKIIEKALQLKLDILARAYQVMVVKAELGKGAINQISLSELDQMDALISRVTKDRPGSILSFHMDAEEMVLIIKGDSLTLVEQHAYLLARLMKEEVESKVECVLSIGLGSPKERLGDVAQSFTEAYETTRSANGQISASGTTMRIDRSELEKIDGALIEQFLKTGIKAELETFYESYIDQLSKSLLNSPIFLHYLMMDLLITASRFINRLGGNPGEILPQMEQAEAVVASLKTPGAIKEATCEILLAALNFRDAQTGKQPGDMIRKAQEYIQQHYTDAEISLSAVAAHVSLSPSHFSVLFGRETGETFVEYLTRQRIEKAKELLRTTGLAANEIAFEVGYNNPRYFYSVFKKVAGRSPSEYRLTAQPGAKT